MDFLSKIKKAISTKATENLADFLGENKSYVDSALSLSLNSFLAGLLKYANSDVELKNIINVLNDGGHTGDILNNFELFSESFEKTQLLVTIGNNISSHFLEKKVSPLIDKISEISDVKKTSASSLLSISAPLILGFIGKTMRVENLDLAGLRNLFSEIAESSINSLPPAISNIFQFKKVANSPVEVKTSPTKPQKEKNHSNNKTNWSAILPWLILGIAGLAALWYAKIGNKVDNIEQVEKTIISEKPQEDLRSEDFLPDSSIVSLPLEKNVVPTTIKEDHIKKKELQQLKVEEKVKQRKIESPLPMVKKETGKAKKKKAAEIKISENKAEDTKTPTGWNALNTNTFNQKSAEISSSSGLNSIVSQLKNSSKTIKISPLSGSNRTLNEDRAYGMREYLIEKGISEDQIIISSSIAGSNPNGIVYRIGN